MIKREIKSGVDAIYEILPEETKSWDDPNTSKIKIGEYKVIEIKEKS